MRHVAVLKPDHLGDLVLASSAIRAISAQARTTLFVGGGSLKLSRYLFSDVESQACNFPHLARVPVPPLDISSIAMRLAKFDTVFILRDDPVMRTLAQETKTKVVIAAGDHLTHDTLIHKRGLEPHIGRYSRTKFFFGQPLFRADVTRRVGLCIAAGFPNNLWPLQHWRELALLLTREGIAFSLIGGPNERPALDLLSASLRHIPHRAIVGTQDFASFLDQLDDLDLIVASDSGSAHICSLRRPILSVFGSSPWRRYAPFGFANMLMTRDLVCSPCVQFSKDQVNGCLTRECLVSLMPKDVLRAVIAATVDSTFSRGTKIFRGVSHLSTA